MFIVNYVKYTWELIFGKVYDVLHYNFEKVILSVLNLHLCSFNGYLKAN